MTMPLRFTKMHGIGNDFIIIDKISQSLELTPENVRKLSDRHFGIGCDQVLVVDIPEHSKNDFRYQIYNHDGTEVENCGNGARCFAKFVRDKKLTNKNTINVETLVRTLTLHVSKNNKITVDMGAPILDPDKIPFQTNMEAISYLLTLPTQTIDISVVSMGNPHVVTIVDNVELAPVEQLGQLISSHVLFPQDVNVGFMTIRSHNMIDLRVYERGVGETLACGTGACAAVVAARLRNLVDPNVTVHLRGGSLCVEWKKRDSPVLMTGSATTVFEGQIKL